MSGTSGRRRAADCGIRWSTATLGTDHVRMTISRRVAGAGKRALTEYPRARLALSLGIVVIGGVGGGGGIARGDAIRLRLLLITDNETRARAVNSAAFKRGAFKLGEPSLMTHTAVKLEASQKRSSSSKLSSFQYSFFHANL